MRERELVEKFMRVTENVRGIQRSLQRLAVRSSLPQEEKEVRKQRLTKHLQHLVEVVIPRYNGQPPTTSHRQFSSLPLWRAD
jgi:hypothetical protein